MIELDKSILKTKTCQYLIHLMVEVANEYELAVSPIPKSNKTLLKNIQKINKISNDLKLKTYQGLSL